MHLVTCFFRDVFERYTTWIRALKISVWSIGDLLWTAEMLQRLNTNSLDRPHTGQAGMRSTENYEQGKGHVMGMSSGITWMLRLLCILWASTQGHGRGSFLGTLQMATWCRISFGWLFVPCRSIGRRWARVQCLGHVKPTIETSLNSNPMCFFEIRLSLATRI